MVGKLPKRMATVRDGQIYDPYVAVPPSGRSIIKGGTVVDPANGIEGVKDISKVWNDLNDLVRDRRTDLNDEMLGYKLGRRLPRLRSVIQYRRSPSLPVAGREGVGG